MAREAERLPMPFDIEARRAQMFPALSPQQLARVLPFGVETTFEDGQIVFEQGARRLPFYVVLEGALAILHPRGELEDIVTIQHEREFTGEVSMLADRRTLVRARAK